ncbi:MAG: GspH/FimT family pseudopilin [Dissulfuribacterales bacterium]
MKNGFTLIELLVVLVIISLASAFVLPRLMAPMGNLTLKTATKKIAASLRFARSRAVSEKITRVGAFDFDNKRLIVFSENKNKLAVGDNPVSGKQSDIIYDFPKGIFLKKAGADEVNSGIFNIVFFPNGSSSGGEVVLSNASGKRFGIRVDFITGMVTLAKLDPAL